MLLSLSYKLLQALLSLVLCAKTLVVTTYVHRVLTKLEENDLYLKPEKCEFEKEEIKYLGVIVGKNHLKMSPKKLQGITDWPIPKTPTNIQ